MLILHDLLPIHWAIAGAGIAAVTLVLLLVGNQRLGISTGFENLCGLLIRAPYFRRSEVTGSTPWRLAFLGGLVFGGFLSAATGGGWAPIWDMGMFDARIGLGHGGKLAWTFAGGLLIGFGTRLAGGCTSGHGIFGMSNLERASFQAVLSFLVAGAITSNLVYRVFAA